MLALRLSLACAGLCWFELAAVVFLGRSDKASFVTAVQFLAIWAHVLPACMPSVAVLESCGGPDEMAKNAPTIHQNVIINLAGFHKG